MVVEPFADREHPGTKTGTGDAGSPGVPVRVYSRGHVSSLAVLVRDGDEKGEATLLPFAKSAITRAGKRRMRDDCEITCITDA